MYVLILFSHRRGMSECAKTTERLHKLRIFYCCIELFGGPGNHFVEIMNLHSTPPSWAFSYSDVVGQVWTQDYFSRSMNNNRDTMCIRPLLQPNCSLHSWTSSLRTQEVLLGIFPRKSPEKILTLGLYALCPLLKCSKLHAYLQLSRLLMYILHTEKREKWIFFFVSLRVS